MNLFSKSNQKGAPRDTASAVKSQPQISEKSQAVSTARWVMERMTREIRNGIADYLASKAARQS